MPSALLGRNGHHQGAAAPFIRHQVHLAQLSLDKVGVGIRPVDFVQCHDNRHTGCLGVSNGLAGLWHHAVIRRHHQHHHIRALGAARPHGRKSRVTGCVQEGNQAALVFDLVRANMLRNAARLAARHVRVADGVQQGGLAMIDMSQNGHHRRAVDQVV